MANFSFPSLSARFSSYQQKMAIALGMGLAALPVLSVATSSAIAQTSVAPAFSDVSEQYWAEDYITALAELGVLSGFPDGSFRPNQAVTRAQYAAMVQKAFPVSPSRNAVNFRDVASSFWAAPAIQSAYTTGFLSGYPDRIFQPNQQIPRVQVLVSLANGLDFQPRNPVDSSLGLFQDSVAIPDYATTSIAAASENGLVVNYPNVDLLEPNQTATRAEVAAFIYQALANQGQAATLSSPYVAQLSGETEAPVQSILIPSGTVLPVRYEDAEKIYVAPDEPNPVPLTLTLSQNVQTRSGRVVIPAGSVIQGELRSENGGTRFYSDRLITNGQSYPMEATSGLITETETIRRGINAGRVIRDSAIGAGAAAILAGVTGDRQIEAKEVLGGAAAGAVAGVFLEKNSVELLVINPDADLDLTIDQAFEMN